ncbi:MAG: hypothetical protein WCK31_00490, partial [bacterium]
MAVNSENSNSQEANNEHYGISIEDVLSSLRFTKDSNAYINSQKPSGSDILLMTYDEFLNGTGLEFNFSESIMINGKIKLPREDQFTLLQAIF